jgi:hypothetical protein
MSGTIYSGKILDINIKGKYLVVVSKSQSSPYKDHFAIESSQSIGYKMSGGEDITFYFKDFPNLQLVLNADLVDEITLILKKLFPMEEVPEQKINLFE